MYLLLLLIGIFSFYRKKFFLKLEKHFGPFEPQNLKANLLPKKLNSVLRLYVAVTSCKKSERFHASIFYKT